MLRLIGTEGKWRHSGARSYGLMQSVQHLDKALLVAQGAEVLPIAGSIPMRSTVERYPLERADEALVALMRFSVTGAKVLTML
ncbi:MAG: hypothetical protein AAFY29_07655 [Pseudomonadota bacterium]